MVVIPRVLRLPINPARRNRLTRERFLCIRKPSPSCDKALKHQKTMRWSTLDNIGQHYPRYLPKCIQARGNTAKKGSVSS
jgi:hypothetical protein